MFGNLIPSSKTIPEAIRLYSFLSSSVIDEIGRSHGLQAVKLTDRKYSVKSTALLFRYSTLT